MDLIAIIALKVGRCPFYNYPVLFYIVFTRSVCALRRRRPASPRTFHLFQLIQQCARNSPPNTALNPQHYRTTATSTQPPDYTPFLKLKAHPHYKPVVPLNYLISINVTEPDFKIHLQSPDIPTTAVAITDPV